MSSTPPSPGGDGGTVEAIPRTDSSGSPHRPLAEQPHQQSQDTNDDGTNGQEIGGSSHANVRGSSIHDGDSGETFQVSSPLGGRSRDRGAESPARSPPPTPLSNFSPPRSFAGSIPRTPSSMGRSLPGTPRTPFTPMDMQVMFTLSVTVAFGAALSYTFAVVPSRPSRVASTLIEIMAVISMYRMYTTYPYLYIQ